VSDDWNIDVALRIRRLPPYLFARINNLRDRKRREGVDMIDLGMGNPHDAPPDEVVEKLCQAAHDPRAHGYSQSIGLPNLRLEVTRIYQKLYDVSLDPEKEVIEADVV